MDVLKCGKVIVIGLELEELSKEGKSLFRRKHDNGSCEGGTYGCQTEEEIEYGQTSLAPCVGYHKALLLLLLVHYDMTFGHVARLADVNGGGLFV